MEAVNVPTANRPPPKPMPATPKQKTGVELNGADRITKVNAVTPIKAPKPPGFGTK